MKTIDEALRQALEPPDSYYGSITDLVRQGWAKTFSRHRDSDILEISNYETILATFAEKYELNEDYRVEGSSHWAVGWVDQIMVRALDCKCEDWEDADLMYRDLHPIEEEEMLHPFLNAGWYCNTCGALAKVRPIFEEVLEIAGQLEEYAVLDEEDYSEREYKDLNEYLEGEIYSHYVHLGYEELSDEGYDDLVSFVSSKVREQACRPDDVGDISDLVEGAYCQVLLQDVEHRQELKLDVD